MSSCAALRPPSRRCPCQPPACPIRQPSPVRCAGAGGSVAPGLPGVWGDGIHARRRRRRGGGRPEAGRPEAGRRRGRPPGRRRARRGWWVRRRRAPTSSRACRSAPRSRCAGQAGGRGWRCAAAAARPSCAACRGPRRSTAHAASHDHPPSCLHTPAPSIPISPSPCPASRQECSERPSAAREAREMLPGTLDMPSQVLAV